MRWKALTVIAALTTATSAQYFTVDAEVYQPQLTVQGDLAITSNQEQYTFDVVPATESSSTTSNSNSEEDVSVDYQSSSNGPHITTSNQPQPPDTEEEDSCDKPQSGENTTPRPNSEENASQRPTTSESESNEKPDAGEMRSSEEKYSLESPEGPAVSSSALVNSDEMDPSSHDDLTVYTTKGWVKGHMWHESTQIIGYIDIPYGKIANPFETAQQPEPWKDILANTEHTKICPQLQNEEYVGTLDCLTLSIFTPKDADNASVLIHIHDSYANSSISADPAVYGPENLVPKGIILVLPNYRVGPLGFLCLRNKTAPGNAGLKDLSLALEWVRHNIHQFGGNPDNIAVSGDGTAGAFAGYLALYDRSKHYISKVITESGSALSHWALDRAPLFKAETLAELIRKNNLDGVIFNNTFEEASLSTVVNASGDMRFYPCLEHNSEPFMCNTPWQMLHDAEIDITFMIGTATYAGTREALEIKDPTIELMNKDFSQLLPEDLVFNNDEEKNKMAQALKSQYFGTDDVTSDRVEELSLWYTDASYLGPGLRFVRLLLRSGVKVYFYEFEFAGKLNLELEAMNRPVQGAVRNDIVGYLFHQSGSTPVDDNSPEKHVIDLMVDLWVSFINTGKPTAEDVTWNEFNATTDAEEEWLLINSESQSKKGVHVDRLRLWTTAYDEHFIEHNVASCFVTHYYVAFIALLMVWMGNWETPN